MKKLSVSEMKSVKGGACVYGPVCGTVCLTQGTCSFYTSLSNSPGYTGGGGSGNSYPGSPVPIIPPYVPPGS